MVSPIRRTVSPQPVCGVLDSASIYAEPPPFAFSKPSFALLFFPHHKEQAHCSSVPSLETRNSPYTATHAHSMAASVACSFFFDAEAVGDDEQGMAAQDACARCTRSLPRDSDVFMYRGDMPFCSEDCRDEQMRHDARQAAKARRQRQFSSGTEPGLGHRESRDVFVAS
ncbi:unnamed protein product [Alopecurus aequalis]